MPCMLLLGNLFGLTGVALALSLGLILKCVLLLVDVKRVLGFDPTFVSNLGYVMKSDALR